MKSIAVEGEFALVDDEDYERIAAHKWRVAIDRKNGRHYATRSGHILGRMHIVYMHREVMGCVKGDGREIDHRDNEATMDNRKQNLREATRSQNNCNRGMRKDNTSGFKGVTAERGKSGWWRAQIMLNKKAVNLGAYPSKEQAAEVYAEAAHRLHGEFARTAVSQ